MLLTDSNIGTPPATIPSRLVYSDGDGYIVIVYNLSLQIKADRNSVAVNENLSGKTLQMIALWN